MVFISSEGAVTLLTIETVSSDGIVVDELVTPVKLDCRLLVLLTIISPDGIDDIESTINPLEMLDCE